MIFKCLECGEDVKVKDYPKKAFFGIFRPKVFCGNCQTMYTFVIEDKASILEWFVFGCSLLYILGGVFVAGGTSLLFSIPITIPFILLAVILSHHNYGLRRNIVLQEDNWECSKCHEHIQLNNLKNNKVHSCPSCNLSYTFVKTPIYPKGSLLSCCLLGIVVAIINYYVKNDFIFIVIIPSIGIIWLFLYLRKANNINYLSIHISEE